MNKKIALFFNNSRGLEVFKKIKKNNVIDLFLTNKNLNYSTLDYLKKRKIKFKIINKINSKTVNFIKKKNYYLLIAAGWPLIFSKELIDSSLKGTINLHAGSLPNYRGGSPINWQIINGEKNININVIKMTKKLDAGPIYFSKNIKIMKNDNVFKIHQKVNKFFPQMVKKTIQKIFKNIEPKPQTKINSKKYKQRSDKDGLINWNKMNSTQVYNFVRALSYPYPGAFYFNINKKLIRINHCKKVNINKSCLPGTIMKLNKKTYIRCKKGFIQTV